MGDGLITSATRNAEHRQRVARFRDNYRSPMQSALKPAGVGPSPEEQRLLKRMLAGDERAFDAFADDFIPRLYRFALGRLQHDGELTRDLVQTTVCKAIAKLDTFRGESTLFTWLCACCRNEIAMHFRRLASRPHEVELTEAVHLADGPEEAPAVQESRLFRQESANRVHLALDHLPAHYAKALEWKYLEDLSVKQIAWRLRVKPKAAESLLTRARDAFRHDYSKIDKHNPAVSSDSDAADETVGTRS